MTAPMFGVDTVPKPSASPTGSYRLWFCSWRGWRASPCMCAIGGYDHNMTGCGWVEIGREATDA